MDVIIWFDVYVGMYLVEFDIVDDELYIGWYLFWLDGVEVVVDDFFCVRVVFFKVDGLEFSFGVDVEDVEFVVGVDGCEE